MESKEFIFNTTTIYEDDLITNIHFTDSSVTNTMPDYEDDFEVVHYSDITTSGTFPADQVPKNNALSPTKSYINDGNNTEQTQIMFATAPSLKTHLKTMNNSVHDENKLISTKKNFLQINKKIFYHMENATSIQNQSISSKTAIKVVNTNIKNTETLKIYVNTPSNATRALSTNKSWIEDKFFPNTKNKTFIPSTQTLQSVHSNFNLYKTESNSVKYDTVLKQTLSIKDKFKQYQDNSFNNIVERGESLNTDSKDNTTDNNSPTETGLSNKALVKHTYNISGFTNQSTDKSAHKMKISYHAVMKHKYRNISTIHSESNSKTQLQSPSHISVQYSVYRNHSTKIPIGFHTNKLKLVDRNNSDNLEDVASKHSNATSSGMNDSGNNETQGISDNATEQSSNITSPLQGVNFVLGNVTLAMGDKSVFYSSHTSDNAFAPGVHITAKEHTPTSLTLGSHPSMFVLLGIGLVMAGAFAMAMSHCANRRRCQDVEYSQQQDIEVRSMSSIGDLW
jgi:hypothetical protein